MRQRNPKYIPREKNNRIVFVNKYDEASDSNRRDKSPQKKVRHKNTSNRIKKGGR